MTMWAGRCGCTSVGGRPGQCCGRYGGPLWSHGQRRVVLVDLPAFGRSVRLVWHKRRWRCAQQGCGAGTVTEQDPEIAPPHEKLTAGRDAGRRARRAGRAPSTRSPQSWDAAGTR